jgi:hypothetical protein
MLIPRIFSDREGAPRMLKRPLAPDGVAVDVRDLDRSAQASSRDPAGGTGPGRGIQEPPAVDRQSALAGSLPITVDSVLTEVAGEFRDDPDSVGLLLHGSRAFGIAGPDSNYDLIVILTDAAYAQRRQRRTLVERRFRSGSPTVEIAYESLDRLRRAARRGGSRGRAFASSIVLLDKSGEIDPLVSATLAGAEPAYERVAEEYDGYLNGFAHSLKSSSRGDDLGARAHAADAALHLVRALFALEGKPAPYLDQLSVRLSELEDAQGWRAGFLRGALLRLLYAPDPPFQQMLDRRVSRLMDSRGIRHEWRHDLELLRSATYDEL